MTRLATARTVDLVPYSSAQMLKPREFVEAMPDLSDPHSTATELTKTDRRIYNRLFWNAFGPGLLDERRMFTIEQAQLREASKSNKRVDESLHRLRHATVVILNPHTGEEAARGPLLGWHTATSPTRGALLQYKIDPRLARVLETSYVFAKLEMPVMSLFRSAYTFPLYERIALKVNLEGAFEVTVRLDELRLKYLWIKPGKLSTFSNLKARALDPAVADIDRLSHFRLSYEERAQGTPGAGGRIAGGKVVAVKFKFRLKTPAELAERDRLLSSDYLYLPEGHSSRS